MPSPNYVDHVRRARRLQNDEIWRILARVGRTLGRLGAAGPAWIRALREARERRRAVAELSGLDRRALRDIGLDRAGIRYAVDHGREDLPAPANVNGAPAQRSVAG